jgi:hypothetical protein
MAIRINTEIDGFEVEVTDRYNDEGRTECFITKGRKGASLALCEDFGTVEEDGPRISDATLEKVRKLAEANGY